MQPQLYKKIQKISKKLEYAILQSTLLVENIHAKSYTEYSTVC